MLMCAKDEGQLILTVHTTFNQTRFRTLAKSDWIEIKQSNQSVCHTWFDSTLNDLSYSIVQTGSD